jgi:hypothetical protein
MRSSKCQVKESSMEISEYIGGKPINYEIFPADDFMECKVKYHFSQVLSNQSTTNLGSSARP